MSSEVQQSQALPDIRGRGPKRRRQEPPLDKLPDRRAMEAVVQQRVAGLQRHTQQDTPLGKAKALMYRAFEEAGEQRRVQLAKDALAVCPDCVDAYVLLAEHATSRKEAMRLYEPEFVARRKQDEPAKEEITAPAASGELKLVLSWVVDEVSG